jgi:hypothetical protein
MANRRQEERERLREAREEREAQEAGSEKRRLAIAYGAAAVLVLILIVAIVVIASSGGGDDSGSAHINQESGSTNGITPDSRAGTSPPPVAIANLKQAAKKAGCDLRLNLKNEGRTHISPGSPPPHYGTNPPTSGDHVDPPYQQADGAYTEMPPEIDIVHSLEHGRMEIQYDPGLPEKAQLELKGLYDTMYGATLLFPNSNMGYAVAATTWTNLLGCPTYKGSSTLDAVRAFGKATWGKAPEPVEGFPFTGPTPGDPSS